MNVPSEKSEKKHDLLPHIRTCIAALLMIAPSMDMQSEAPDTAITTKQPSTIFYTQEKNASQENIEVNEELLFKSTVTQALRSVNSLKSVPEWGIQLKYPQSYTWNLPRSIDFFPKEIKKETIPYTIIRIWEKMFMVSPDLWFEADKMYIDKDAFYVHVVKKVRWTAIAGKEIAKSKEKGLPDYLYKLFTQWESWHYPLSRVRAIPKEHQKAALEALAKLNK